MKRNIPSHEIFSNDPATKQGVVFTTTGYNLTLLIGENGAADQLRYFAKPDKTNRTYDVYAYSPPAAPGESWRIDFSVVIGFIFTESSDLVVKVVDAAGVKQVYRLRPTRYGRQPTRQRHEDRSYLLAH